MRHIPYADIERAFTRASLRRNRDEAIHIVLRKSAVPGYERAFAMSRQLMIQGSRWDQAGFTAEIQRRVATVAPG